MSHEPMNEKCSCANETERLFCTLLQQRRQNAAAEIKRRRMRVQYVVVSHGESSGVLRLYAEWCMYERKKDTYRQ